MDYPWGKPKQAALEELWVVVTYLYHGVPNWKQVPMTLDLDSTIPRDFISEVGVVLKEVMRTLGKELDQEAQRQKIEGWLASSSLQRMTQGGVIPQEAVSGGVNPLHLESHLVEELAERMRPRVVQGILDGIRQSLAIQFETLPFNLNSPQFRKVRMAQVQDSRPDPDRKPTPFSGQPMIARTVVGGAIWEPTVIPFVIPKAWIGNLLEPRSHLSFSMIDLGKSSTGFCMMTPYPWTRYDLTNPLVDPVVTFPLAEIGCPPDTAKIRTAAVQYQEGSPARMVLETMGGHPEMTRWFGLVDHLEWDPGTHGKTGIGGDEQ